jgi:hypothetical protein
MQKLSVAVLFGLLIAIPGGHAQNIRELHERAVATELDVERQELVTLEKENAHALAQHNSTFVRRVYSDDFAGTLATGEVVDRASLASVVQTCTAIYSTFLVTDIHIRIFEATSVVTCTWTARGTQGGHLFARQYRVIHVYLNGVGGWKVIASQEMLLPG